MFGVMVGLLVDSAKPRCEGRRGRGSGSDFRVPSASFPSRVKPGERSPPELRDNTTAQCVSAAEGFPSAKALKPH